MAFSNNPDALELVIPENGPLTAGSGTIYLGGPHLPTELTNVIYGIDAAIIFYSSANDSAETDYYFIAHMDSASYQGWVRGNTHNGTVFINEFTRATGLASPSDSHNLAYTLSVDSYVVASGSDMQFITNDTGSNFQGLVTFTSSSGTEYVVISGLGFQPVISAKGTSSTIDVLLTDTSTVTIVTIANVVVTTDWYVGMDWDVHMNMSVSFPSAPATLILSIPIPAAVPKPMTTYFGAGPGDTGGPGAGFAVAFRCAAPYSAITTLSGTTNPTSLKRFFFTAHYPTAKP